MCSSTSFLLIGDELIQMEKEKRKRTNVWRAHNFTKLTIKRDVTRKDQEKRKKERKKQHQANKQTYKQKIRTVASKQSKQIVVKKTKQC